MAWIQVKFIYDGIFKKNNCFVYKLLKIVLINKYQLVMQFKYLLIFLRNLNTDVVSTC